ncbi:MAG: hypothetical protein A2X35_04030 [Elusimicrobia bacterium GWA2_61_42]|nr:MAG: hypothetical protein A2X35_04030 [Elusimicrobia bacterium GWA2_61_42]OGR74427.1 MAG: hypothetical protein A2X38_00805 [Elusimicrobia bacterium GWC2_61_25]
MTEDQVPENTPPVSPPPPPQPKALYGRGTLLAIGVAVSLYAGITAWKQLHPNPPPAVPEKDAAAAPAVGAASTDAPAASTDTWSGVEASTAPEAAPAASPEAATPDATRQEGSQ